MRQRLNVEVYIRVKKGKRKGKKRVNIGISIIQLSRRNGEKKRKWKKMWAKKKRQEDKKVRTL